MDTETTPVEKKGLSRRQVIVGGAVGSAAFWSVPVIDSVISRAAAGSSGFPCSWSLLVYYLPGTTIDSSTFFVNGWGSGNSSVACSQGNNGKFNSVVTTWLGPTGQKVTVDFTNSKQVTITDPATGAFITIPLPGGSGSLSTQTGGGTVTDCSSGQTLGLTNNGRTFTLSGTEVFLAAIAFGGSPENKSPASSTQSVTFTACT